MIFSLALAIMVLFTTTTTPAAAYWNPSGLDMEFVDAYYDDLDADGVEDDVLLDLYIEILDFTYWDSIFGRTLTVVMELELPSGAYYDYAFEITTYQATFNFVLECYDHATETGDYTAHALGVINGYEYGLYTYLLFDPPGSGLPVDPSIKYFCY